MRDKLIVALSVTAISTVALLAQDKPKTGGHDMPDMSQEEMNKRGDKVMGFDHTKTTHHFLLLKDGGAIEVNANEASDIKSRDEIRGHLSHIAMMFADGNFNAPILIHDQNPPGADLMKQLNQVIHYQFEQTERGGRVGITTENPEALKAIHDFLRFQIKEHKTGDPLDVG